VCGQPTSNSTQNLNQEKEQQSDEQNETAMQGDDFDEEMSKTRREASATDTALERLGTYLFLRDGIRLIWRELFKFEGNQKRGERILSNLFCIACMAVLSPVSVNPCAKSCKTHQGKDWG